MHSWFQRLRDASARQRATKSRRTSKPRRSSVPQLIPLEDRTVLSVLMVLNNADSGAGSLRDTIAAAQSGDTIVFDPSLAYETITLSSGPLASAAISRSTARAPTCWLSAAIMSASCSRSAAGVKSRSPT